MAAINASVRRIVDVFAASTRKGKEKQRKCANNGVISDDAVRLLTLQWRGKSRQKNKLTFRSSARILRMLRAQDPFVKFRRIARAVIMMVKVCGICRNMVLDAIAKEDWFDMMKSSVADNEDVALSRRPRPFVTFVPDDDNNDLVQLSFDKSEYSREFKSDYLLTEEMRRILSIKPCFRNKEHQNELVRFMKRMSKQFNAYPLDVQRRLADCMVYDRYLPKRVITKQGQTADGVYFVLSGQLMEKSELSHELRELKPGDRFGEEDLIAGCARRTTVLTKITSEVVAIHRLDYRAIFNMADDSNDPRYLDVCKHDVVFQHFPLKKLIENPGVWTLLSYKFGRLIVKNSNNMEWIYVVKSGEARVMKQLTVGSIDLNARRKQVQAKINDDDPHYQTKKMIRFVTDNEEVKSKRDNTSQDIQRRHRNFSAPMRREAHFPSLAQKSCYNSLPSTPYSKDARPSTAIDVMDGRPLTKDETSPRVSDGLHSHPEEQEGEQDHAIPSGNDVIALPLIAASRGSVTSSTALTPGDYHKKRGSLLAHSSHSDLNSEVPSSYLNNKRSSGTYLHTGKVSGGQHARRRSKTAKPRLMEVPPFVQLESLHSGKVFGLRACLEPQERGPPVSLVSGGCEVLQINKKFFLKHLDEAMMGLIKAHHKAFPSEEELVDRLDANLQWQQYKEATVKDFYKKQSRSTRCRTTMLS